MAASHKESGPVPGTHGRTEFLGRSFRDLGQGGVGPQLRLVRKAGELSRVKSKAVKENVKLVKVPLPSLQKPGSRNLARGAERGASRRVIARVQLRLDIPKGRASSAR